MIKQMNPDAVYIATAISAATATKWGDYSRANAEHRHFSAMLHQEPSAEVPRLRELYRNAYREVSR